MILVQKLVLSLCLIFFVRASCLNYHCHREWKENELNYNHSIFVRNNRHAITLDWAKIFPDVYTSKVNTSEVNFYKEQLDTLLQQGIEPVVTLFSGNLPAAIGPLGGWTNPIIIQYYANYARQSFKIFGNRVKTWITFDEPRTVCDSFQGLIGDEMPSGLGEYLCAHNVLKAHAEAYHIYDKEFRITQDGKVSIILDMVWAEPADHSDVKHIRAAERKVHFEFGLYANPILNFDYPAIVVDRIAKRSKVEGFSNSRLPEFTYAEKLRISGSYDYLEIKEKGIVFVVASDSKRVSKPSTQIDCGCKTRKNKYSDNNEKWAKKNTCQRMLNWIKTTYCNPEVVITNSDVTSDESDADKPKNKVNHKEYMRKMLKGVLELNELLKG